MKLLVVAALAATAAAAAPMPSQSSIVTIMNNMYKAFLGTNPPHDCSWTRGTYMAGHMAYYETTKNPDALTYAINWGDSFGWQTCSHDTNANDECAVQAYVEVARLTDNSTRITPARATMQGQIDSNDTTSWWWIDATFMALPAFVRMGNYTGETAFFDQGRKLFEQTAFEEFHLWVEADNLFLRDDTYVNKTCPNGRPVYWSRGNGWAAAALVRALAELPDSRGSDRDLYTLVFRELAYSLRAIQTSGGYWPASLLDADQVPGPETTGSALFTFALASGINQGIIPRADFEDAVLGGWNYLANTAVQPSGLPGYCQPVGGSPAPTSPTDFSDFCVGQVLLAASELYKMAA